MKSLFRPIRLPFVALGLVTILCSFMSSNKSSICWLKPRVLIYDPTLGSCTIETDENVKENPDDFWPVTFGPRTHPTDTWELYWKCSNQDEQHAIAIRPNEAPEKNADYITRLKLSKLGSWGTFLRRIGALNNGYILK
ncbi:hypothetical protein F5Y16DRAFT_392730 [Xylariaceae sp. FL0255]|nr:hypothetical protein F5Y16DRAFT_392730 [Xylariaceae sp. FL0255]